MGERKAFIKDTVVYGLGNGLKKFIGLFLLPFYTRALSVGEFGMLETLGTTAALLGGFFSAGLESSCGFYFFKASDDQKGDVLSTAFFFKDSLISADCSVTVLSGCFFSTSFWKQRFFFSCAIAVDFGACESDDERTVAFVSVFPAAMAL